MSNYTIKAKQDTQSDNWGDFQLYKDFNISHISIPTKQIYGYVIQEVVKITKLYTYDNNNLQLLTTTEEIMDFTSGQVNYAKGTYYEVFYIVGGKSVSGDMFTNGALLHYNIDNINDIYADDEVPTAGIVCMTGKCYFIEASKEEVNKKIKTKSRIVNIIGLEWDTNEDLPAHGLPYRADIPIDIIGRSGGVLNHKVVAIWNGINNKINHDILNNNLLDIWNTFSESNNKYKNFTKKTYVSSEFN
jgi:uncharacterized protein YlzI (FlbEa/FlbD family)